MGGKTRIQPASRVGLDPLVGMAEQLLSLAAGWEDVLPPETRRRSPTVMSLDLAHLARHDGDGLLTVSIADDVVAFGSCFLRSRILHISHLWLLPEHVEQPTAQTLIRRMLVYGERAAALDCVALTVAGAWQQSLLFRFGLRPRFPVYRMVLDGQSASRLGTALAAGLPGADVTEDVLSRRTGAADVERLDRLVRGATRPGDHEYWLASRGLRLAAVREGKRVAGYAYGGPDQCGPVVASTGEAALAGLGWALKLASTEGEEVQVLLPSPFEAGVEAILEAGGRCSAVGQWMSRQPAGGFERTVLSGITLL